MKEIPLILVFSVLCVHAPFTDHRNYQQSPLAQSRLGESLLTPKYTIRALEKIVLYFAKHMHNATVDLAFGLRVIEGELNRALSMFDKVVHTEFSTDKSFHRRLKNLYRLSKDAVAQSLQHIKANNRQYFDETSFLVEDEWSAYQLTPQFTVRNSLKVFPVDFDGGLSEADSDTCMNSIAGKKQYEKCSLGNCWNVMSAPGHSLYFTTHQILWILLGTKYGCHEKLHQAAINSGYKGIDDVIKLKCASVVVEMEALAMDGVIEEEQDIFLEQGFVCGGIGFLDAVRPEWLQVALQWQNSQTGCYENGEDGDGQFIEELEYWINVSKRKWKPRKLQMDTTLEDGCSTHKTAVAAAFLATYLRLYFDPIYKKHMLDPYLNRNSRSFSNAPPIMFFYFLLFIAAICVIVFFQKRVMLLLNFTFRKLNRKENHSVSRVI